MENLKTSFIKEEAYDFGTNLAEDAETPNNQLYVVNSDTTSDTSDSECERVFNDTGLLGSARSGGPQGDRPPQAAALQCRGQGENHTPNPPELRRVSREGKCDGAWAVDRFCEGCSNSRWCPFHGQNGSAYCKFGPCQAALYGDEHIDGDTALLKRRCILEEDRAGEWVCAGCPCPYNGALCDCNERN